GQYPKMRWHRFEPIGTGHHDEAMKLAFGRTVTTHVRLDRCDVVVSLDHDLLGSGPHQVPHAAAWAARRGEVAPGQGRIRLHMAESVTSLTRTVASGRLPCDASRMLVLAQSIGAAFALPGFAVPELSAAE